MQRQIRAGIGVENGSPGSPVIGGSPLGNGSPLGHLRNAVGQGSPVPKRRSAQTSSDLDSSPFSKSPLSPSRSGSVSSSKRTPPKRSSLRKSTGQLLSQTDRPTFARLRPQAKLPEFATPTDPASKIRRIASVENFSALGSLPSASVHPRKAISKSRAIPKDLAATDNLGGREWVTPQNYKNAKPNPAAFHSTGFVPKRGRLSLGSEIGSHHQPDTPCKKTNTFSVPTTAGKESSDSKSIDFPSPIAGTKLSSFNLLKRKESIIQPNDVSPTTSFGNGDLSSSGEFELPPTPTKTIYGNVGAAIFANVGGTKRKGESRPASPYSVGGRSTRARVRESPNQPKEQLFPDPRFLSLHTRKAQPPATPAKDYFPSLEFLKSKRPPRTPGNLPLEHSPGAEMSPSMTWSKRFEDVKLIGTGEFSQVYLAYESAQQRLTGSFSSSQNNQLASPRVSSPFGCSSPDISPRRRRMYAIKKSKTRYTGVKDRDRKLEEVRILMELGRHEHVVEFVDNWEEDKYLYIQTEYCENGSLDKFLDLHGSKGRLDEFRVWKIMIELLLGVKHIHDCGFMHLDLKPSNVLITFEGTLKISDFGMATRWPASPGVEREGDREYIAPEVLQTNRYDKPVDIFSLGLTIIETAGNEALPPNGPVWQSLRSGDLSGAPILSTSVSGEFVVRDEDGNPISTELLDGFPETKASTSSSSNSSSDEPFTGLLSPSIPRRRRAFYRTQSGSKKLLHTPRAGDLIHPPKFMEDGGLERIVQRMLAPDPQARPTAAKLLEMEEIAWVDKRRRAPATIFEGLWGPDIREGLSDDDTMESHPNDDSVDDWDLVQ